MVANPRFCCHLTYALQNDGCEWKMIEEDDARRIVQSGIAGRMQKLVVFHEDGEEDQDQRSKQCVLSCSGGLTCSKQARP